MTGPFARIGEKMADRLAERTWERLEDFNALPLPTRGYDVVVDDPQLSARHVHRDVLAATPTAAGIEAYKRVMRAEGFRCVVAHPAGDERTVDVARDVMSAYTVVHLAGQHPAIDYSSPPVMAERVDRQR